MLNGTYNEVRNTRAYYTHTKSNGEAKLYALQAVNSDKKQVYI